MREDLQARLQAAGGLRFFERRDQVGERAVVDAPAALRRRDGETDRQVRLADARRPEEDHILAALDEAELVQTLDLLAAQRRLKREVEVVELLDDGQSTGAHRGLQPPVIAQLNLRGEQLLDRLRRRERAAIDAVENRIERFEGAGHAQVREDVAQPVAARERRGLHAAPPARLRIGGERALLDRHDRTRRPTRRASTAAAGRGPATCSAAAASGCSRKRSSRSKRSRGRSRVVPCTRTLATRSSQCCRC